MERRRDRTMNERSQDADDGGTRKKDFIECMCYIGVVKTGLHGRKYMVLNTHW